LRQEHAEQQEKGAYRVGSSGCVTDDGKVYGTCHRKAHLRDLGVESEPSFESMLMWEDGFENERKWEKWLAAAGIKLKSQVEVRHTIDGVSQPIIGHPDIVMEREQDEGIELKGIFGYGTFDTVFWKKRPKNENLIQAATYSWFLKIKYSLTYVMPFWQKLQPWDKKNWSGRFSSVPPFLAVFDLVWKDDKLTFRREDGSETATVITGKGIEDYYRLLDEMKAAKRLGPRVNANYVDGTPNRYGDHADCTLCPFRTACDQYDIGQDYDAWLENSKQLAESGEGNDE